MSEAAITLVYTEVVITLLYTEILHKYYEVWNTMGDKRAPINLSYLPVIVWPVESIAQKNHDINNACDSMLTSWINVHFESPIQEQS